MADRFHFNPESGRTGKCSAQVQCRFGQSEEQHGASREEARANYEAQMEPDLFSNTASKGADREPKPLTKRGIAEVRAKFLETRVGAQGNEYYLWRNDKARAAGIRTALELQGIDSSYIGSAELLRGSYYYLNQDRDRVARVYSNRGDAERDGWGPEMLTKDSLAKAAEDRLTRATPVDSDALRSFEATLAKEESWSYPKLVKGSNRFTDSQLDSEAAGFEYDNRYSVADMIETRGITERDIDEAELEYQGWIQVKIPSGSEAEFSTELARREFQKLEDERRSRNRPYGW